MVHMYILARAQARFLNNEGFRDKVMWAAGGHKEILMEIMCGENVFCFFFFLKKKENVSLSISVA